MSTIKLGLSCVAAMLLAGCVGYSFPVDAYPGGQSDGYYGRDDYYGGQTGGYQGGYQGSYGSGLVRCESNDKRMRRCGMDTRGGVRLVRRLSDSSCNQGRDWGHDRSGIWVSNGCRADFAAGGGYDSGYGGGYGSGYGGTIRCESNDNRMRRCNANTRGGVQLVRKISNSSCDQGRDWGYDRSGIWVSNGCRAEFATGRGGGYQDNGYGGGSTLRCESNDNRQRRCSANVRGGVQLVRKLSDSSCDQGRDWGWDRSGIWVANGCRAEFRVY